MRGSMRPMEDGCQAGLTFAPRGGHAWGMGETLRNIVRGIGSVLEIAPRNDYSHLVPDYSPQEALAMDFARAGDDLRAAMGRATETRTRGDYDLAHP